MPRSGVDPHPAQLSLFGEEAVPVAGLSPAPLPPSAAQPGGLSTGVPAAGAGAPGQTGAAVQAFPERPEPPTLRADRSAADGLAPATFRHPRAAREVLLSGHRVAYEFRRARRRSIGFVVGADGLTVSAPRWVGLAEVEAALREKSRWILRKLQEQAERARRMEQSRIDWRDGTTVPFLGEPLIVVVDPRAAGARLNADAQALPGVPRLTLHVGLMHDASPAQLREAVQGWLQRQAMAVFQERCAEFSARLGVRVRRLTLSSASTRWGSASADGSIRLNWRLIHFGLPVIDYVVVHEMAHLREMNHSQAFWEVVRSVMPDYETARVELRDRLLPVMD